MSNENLIASLRVWFRDRRSRNDFDSLTLQYQIVLIKLMLGHYLNIAPSFGPHTRSVILKKIDGIQRYFTRRGLKHVGLPYMERLSVLKLESLEVRRIRADLKLSFKIIYGLCDFDTNDFLHFVSLLICNQRSG